MGLRETIVVSIVVLAYFGLILFPAVRILRRTGYSPWLAIAALIPVANLVLLWFIAFSPWTVNPGADDSPASAGRPRLVST